MIRLIAVLLLPLLTACSALILSTGTRESHIISPFATATRIEQRLGAALRVTLLDTPMSLAALRITEKDLVINATGTPEPAAALVVKKAEYAFHGRLRRNDDVREAIGMDVISLGLTEAFYFPWSVSERALPRDHVLVVWYDSDDRALAYRWQRNP